jgi:asparagine N-glycosylation enzyme membrane subunit Stt3
MSARLRRRPWPPAPAYGVVILVVILVCLVLLAYRGLDVMIATNALVTLTLAVAGLTGRLLRNRGHHGHAREA